MHAINNANKWTARNAGTAEGQAGEPSGMPTDLPGKLPTKASKSVEVFLARHGGRAPTAMSVWSKEHPDAVTNEMKARGAEAKDIGARQKITSEIFQALGPDSKEIFKAKAQSEKEDEDGDRAVQWQK